MSDRIVRDLRWWRNVPLMLLLVLVIPAWVCVVVWPTLAVWLRPVLYRSAGGFGVLAAVSGLWAVYGLARRLRAWWVARPSEEAIAALLLWYCYAVVPTLLAVQLAVLFVRLRGWGILPRG
ncbi:MAG: hypothetical protein QME87_09935 [Bacillota bacterium]|nr:hypothetical protein [Bacillota bacterium]